MQIPIFISSLHRMAPFTMHNLMIMVCRLVCQKQASRAGTSNYIPRYLWDVITCPCLDTCFWHTSPHVIVYLVMPQTICCVLAEHGLKSSSAWQYAVNSHPAWFQLLHLSNQYAVDAWIKWLAFSDNIFKYISFNENSYILVKILLKLSSGQ